MYSIRQRYKMINLPETSTASINAVILRVRLFRTERDQVH